MLQIKDTKNMIGITIHGDYEDLNALHSALSDYLRFYFAHQDDVESSSCYENILGLCYDIRHAYQGDRNIEAVDNNYENIGQLASCIFSVDSQSLQKERNKYKSGNLYLMLKSSIPGQSFICTLCRQSSKTIIIPPGLTMKIFIMSIWPRKIWH